MTLVAVLGALSGVGIYRLVDLVLKNRRQNVDVAAELRDELRADNKELKKRVAELQKITDDFERYRRDVYKLLVDRGVDGDIIDDVWEL